VTSPSDYNEAGCAHAGAGEWEPALECFRVAISASPGSAAYHNNASLAACQLGLLEEAEMHGEQAVKLSPGSALFNGNLGRVLETRKDYQRAAKHYARALQAGGDSFLYRRLGTVLSRAYRFVTAAYAMEAALKLGPCDAKLWNGLAHVLCSAGELSKAEEAWNKAIACDQSLHAAHSARLIALHYMPEKTAEAIYREHRTWGAQVEAEIAELPPPVRSARHRLRLAYLSPHTAKGAVSAFSSALDRHHDRASFEIVHLSDANEPTPGAHATAKLTNPELAALVRHLEIDVLVDLGGHSSQLDRLLALAERPAPLQITMIGYPDTTGLTRVDYRVTDSIANPPGAEYRHSERLMRLDPCFLCYTPPADAPAVEECPAEAPFTFGCFNAYPKLNAQTFRAWARILKAVPGARLVLKNLEFTDPDVRELASDLLQEADIDTTRVDLIEPALDQAGHLSEYQRMDIFLDCFPYNGTTTTCEALWMGVPGVTLAGHTHVQRVGASLLNACGLADWVTHSWDEYVERAVRAARECAHVRGARRDMRDRLSRSILFDAESYTRRFEQRIVTAVV
jgi:protein O-GlcNAc transferase